MSNAGLQYDVVVVGGGPAGIMTAGRAAQAGARVLLLEKNKSLGKKILITGKGRCNITQAEFDNKELVKAYGEHGKFLFSGLHRFGPQAVVDFFEEYGLKIKVERGGRVFPESDDARDVIYVLKQFLEKSGVKVFFGAEVKNFVSGDGVVKAVILKDGEKIEAKKFVIATGGLSYPLTGATGDGYRWAQMVGHQVNQPLPALVPLKISDLWVKKLQGLSLKNVELTAWQNNKKITSRFGEMMFTHFGITGPIVLDISKTVISIMGNGPVTLSLNLKPALTAEQLDQRLQRDFQKYSNKRFRNALDDLLPQKFIPVMIELSGIDSEKSVHSISKEERKKLHELFSSLKMNVVGNMGYDLAIVTSGGIDLKEIDPRTMQSKIFSNLYFAGEVLDIDGPTGGYNLQVAWSTGYLAGEAVGK